MKKLAPNLKKSLKTSTKAKSSTAAADEAEDGLGDAGNLTLGRPLGLLLAWLDLSLRLAGFRFL